jgi:hypothetical protein
MAGLLDFIDVGSLCMLKKEKNSWNLYNWWKFVGNRRMLIYGQNFHVFPDKSTPKNAVLGGPILPYGSFNYLNPWVLLHSWSDVIRAYFEDLQSIGFGLHVHFSTPVANSHDFEKIEVLGGKWPPKIGLGKFSSYWCTTRTRTRRLTYQPQKSDHIYW